MSSEFFSEKYKYIKLVRQFAMYIITGGTAFVVDAGTLHILTTYFGVFYLYSAIIGFCAGLLTNYFLSLVFVFNAKSSLRDFLIVLVIGLFGLALTEAGLYLGHGILHMSVLFTKCIVAGIVFIWNFAARKIIVYRN